MWGIVGINDIHCHLLLEESKGQGVQRLACQTLVSLMLRVSPLAYKGETSFFPVTSSSPTNQLCFFFFFQEQSVLSLLHLLQGLQGESKDCEKDHYNNKTRKPNNTKMPSLVSVMISLKQIRRLPGARRSHFDVCFPGYNGGQAVAQHLDTTPEN